MADSYEDAEPVDRWITIGGERCWMRGDDCPHCRHPIATNGSDVWCTACQYEEGTA